MFTINLIINELYQQTNLVQAEDICCPILTKNLPIYFLISLLKCPLTLDGYPFSYPIE